MTELELLRHAVQIIKGGRGDAIFDIYYKLSSDMKPIRERIEEIERIERIEAYTQSDVKFELMLIGIDQNSGSWDDYEKAKKRIFGAWYINPKIYQQQIKWITEYIGV